MIHKPGCSTCDNHACEFFKFRDQFASHSRDFNKQCLYSPAWIISVIGCVNYIDITQSCNEGEIEGHCKFARKNPADAIHDFCIYREERGWGKECIGADHCPYYMLSSKGMPVNKHPASNSFNEILEKLAELEHVQWAHWTQYMLDNSTPENIVRWRKQIATLYSELSKKEKESDREWARKVLALIVKSDKDVLTADELEVLALALAKMSVYQPDFCLNWTDEDTANLMEKLEHIVTKMREK